MPTEAILADLKRSGLSIEDMRVRALENPERAATSIPANVDGYVIPYYDAKGTPLPFYRVRAFDHVPKYKQIKGTGNHVYFPRKLRQILETTNHRYLIITEGEKKAAAVVNAGFPCVGLGGVDSWKNKTIVLPEGAKVGKVQGKDNLSIKIDDVDFGSMEAEAGLAAGMQAIIDLAVEKKMVLIICYDTESDGKVGFDVQRAASQLAFELRYKGVPFNKIKQMFLPIADEQKVALDDYILKHTARRLGFLIDGCLANPKGFPKHPNIQDYISKRLNRQKLFRKEAQQIAIAVLADLDAKGSRLRNKHTDQMYYFHDDSKELMDATLKESSSDAFINTPFARYIWLNYGIGSADARVLGWIATLFTSEEHIGVVEPSRVLKVQQDSICYQLNDGQYIRVTGNPQDPYHIYNNGTGGVLFEAGMVEPLDAKSVMDEIGLQRDEKMIPLWPKVLSDVRLRNKEGNQTKLLALLFYLSPWLQRWRGTQLPIEMAIGEPGSGKSSLYELRLDILIGRPDLRNAPNDLKDWYASVSSTGGLHVTDNVAQGDKSLMQRLSDEMCRLVTEPIPHIEMRKYFTNSDLVKLPIFSTFAITAVKQPFHNADLMQRSIIIEFDKGEDILEYESRWSAVQLQRFGGRVRWLVHHLVVLHRFLRAVSGNWDERYRAKYRLVNVEQALKVMARVIGMDDEWIGQHLTQQTLEATVDADWAFEGICAFCDYVRKAGQANKKRFTSSDIVDWARLEEEYEQCGQLTNARSLGRYISSHKQMLATMSGLRDAGKYGNRDSFFVTELPGKTLPGARTILPR